MLEFLVTWEALIALAIMLPVAYFSYRRWILAERDAKSKQTKPTGRQNIIEDGDGNVQEATQDGTVNRIGKGHDNVQTDRDT